MSQPRQSLRSKLLWPLVAVSVSASVVVAIGSYWLASNASERGLEDRYQSIATTLQNESFPLSQSVLASIATFTNADLIAAKLDGTLVDSTMGDAAPAALLALRTQMQTDRKGVELTRIQLGQVGYRAGVFRRTSVRSNSQSAALVAVLFNESRLRAALIQAVVAPLATGLSTIVLLTTITLVLTSRLVGRLARLENQVGRIANGDFQTTVVSGPPDEVGLLASAVGSMATQLQRMWQTLHQREGERLLHQVAAGLAHNLRNSLTGARMAIELHQKRCDQRSDEGLGIALHEIGQTESYVQRLLVVAAGKQDVDRPMQIIECFDDLKASLGTMAAHMNVTLSWSVESSFGNDSVLDGPSLIAAVANLVFNAMSVSNAVEVRATRGGDGRISIDVIDDGPGPSPEVRETLFDPFITTKLEGLGLGLPLVRRASRRLGGDVSWMRKEFKTIFTMTANLQ